MADPIVTDWYRVLAVFPRGTGLPEDAVVNAWAFRNDGALTPQAMADTCRNVLDAFYTQQNGTATTTVMSLMGDVLEAPTYKAYDLGQAPPRQPYEAATAATWSFGPSPLPEEVAVCLSYVATRNLKRQRGRLYIGPLHGGAVEESGDRIRTSSLMRTTLAESAKNVLNTSENVTWGFISPTDADAKVITGGWIDDALDTVRSRGPAPSTRLQWGTYT